MVARESLSFVDAAESNSRRPRYPSPKCDWPRIASLAAHFDGFWLWGGLFHQTTNLSS